MQETVPQRHLHGYRIKVRTSGGHRPKFPKTLSEVPIKPSDSKALYRKAMISQDPRDRFRELFLVIENISSKIVPSNKKLGMRALIEAAIRKCFTFRLHELEDFTMRYRFNYEGDIIKSIASYVYTDYRTYLFHAKASRGKYLPFNEEDEWKVQRILPLAEFLAISLLTYEDKLSELASSKRFPLKGPL